MNEEKTLHIQPPKYIEWGAVFALTMLGLFLLVETFGVLNNVDRSGIPATDTITVSGTGNAYAAPDIAKIDLTVTHTEATVAGAQDATTKQTNAVIDFIKKQGIADKDVKTVSYYVSPQYAYRNPCSGGVCPQYYDSTPKITGYQVSQMVEVTVRDLDKVSGLLQGLGQQNVQSISGPNFTLEDPNAPQNEARGKAIADAEAEAKELARQLGVRLVRIVSFNEGSNYPYYAYGKGGAVMATDSAPSAPQPEIPTGQNEYSSNVSITYEIR